MERIHVEVRGVSIAHHDRGLFADLEDGLRGIQLNRRSPPQQVELYFSDVPPQTGDGNLLALAKGFDHEWDHEAMREFTTIGRYLLHKYFRIHPNVVSGTCSVLDLNDNVIVSHSLIFRQRKAA